MWEIHLLRLVYGSIENLPEARSAPDYIQIEFNITNPEIECG